LGVPAIIFSKVLMSSLIFFCGGFGLWQPVQLATMIGAMSRENFSAPPPAGSAAFSAASAAVSCFGIARVPRFFLGAFFWILTIGTRPWPVGRAPTLEDRLPEPEGLSSDAHASAADKNPKLAPTPRQTADSRIARRMRAMFSSLHAAFSHGCME